MSKTKLKLSLEREIIKTLKNPVLRNALKYLVLDLITEQYDHDKLIKLAKKEGLSSRLGYLAETTAIALEMDNLPESKKLYSLSKALYENFTDWQYIKPNMPDFAKRIFKSSPQPALNKKWKIWGIISSEETYEWIKLHKFIGAIP